MTLCHCQELPVLWTAEADRYAGAHLVREGDGIYRCPVSGRRWLQDFPVDDLGVKTLRLRWEELSPADVVAYLATDPGVDEFLRMMDPDVEHQPLPEEPVLHGLDELRAYTDEYLREANPPRSGAISVIERGEDAVVLGHVSHNHDGRYVEHRPAAWIVTVRDGRVVRVKAYSDWSRARAVAGVQDAEPRRLGSGFIRFLLRRPALA